MSLNIFIFPPTLLVYPHQLHLQKSDDDNDDDDDDDSK